VRVAFLSCPRVRSTTTPSGDDYVLEFLGYRFAFGAEDFRERVMGAAVKLDLIADSDLDEEETSRSRRARGGRADRAAAQLVRLVSDAPLGAPLAERRRVARVLAAEARVPRRRTSITASRRTCSR
jgi:hypothetical protein